MKKLFLQALVALTMVLVLSTVVVFAQEPDGWTCRISPLEPNQTHQAKYHVVFARDGQDREQADVLLPNPPAEKRLLVWADRRDLLGYEVYDLLFKLEFAPNGADDYTCRVIGAYDY